MTPEKIAELKEFLSQFKRYGVPAKYVVAHRLLVEEEEDFEDTDFDYVSDAYNHMQADRKRGVKY
jgi:hypothetical protein